MCKSCFIIGDETQLIGKKKEADRSASRWIVNDQVK